MYTRVLRTAVLCTFVMPALLSCAGDDDTANQGEPCTMAGMMSTVLVDSPGDPCPQDEKDSYGKTICDKNQGFMAVSTCNPDGSWQYPCRCIQRPGMCGNAKKEGAEQCDGVDMGGATCAMVMGNPSSTGMLTCSSTCAIVSTGCTTGGGPMGGAGG